MYLPHHPRPKLLCTAAHTARTKRPFRTPKIAKLSTQGRIANMSARAVSKGPVQQFDVMFAGTVPPHTKPQYCVPFQAGVWKLLLVQAAQSAVGMSSRELSFPCRDVKQNAHTHEEFDMFGDVRLSVRRRDLTRCSYVGFRSRDSDNSPCRSLEFRKSPRLIRHPLAYSLCWAQGSFSILRCDVPCQCKLRLSTCAQLKHLRSGFSGSIFGANMSFQPHR